MNVTLKLNKLDVPVKHFTFSGGEEQVVIDPSFTPKGGIGYVDIYAKLKSSSDIMALVMLTDACRRLKGLHPYCIFTLHMPYIPYARQDRVMNNGESLAIKAFTGVINSLQYHKVIVDDPHSDVSSALLNNVEVRTQDEIFSEYVSKNPIYSVNKGRAVVIAPDAGARKKAQKVAERYHLQLVEAGKVRDTKTGAITGTEIYGDVKDQTCVMVDDLCDGGFTFIKLAEALTNAGAYKTHLFVTHGIFSKGKQVLFDAGIDSVHAYHDWTENF